MNNHNRMLKALLFASALAASAAAQDTAYVPFLVTANAESATVKAQQGEKIFLKEVAAGVEDTLHIILEGVPAFARPGIAAPSPVTMHSSRGRLSLELSPQHYRSVEISLYSLGGKRVLHGQVNASDASRSISRSDIATGVYVLYIRGSGGSFSTRLSHQGGGMDIDVSFGGGVSPLRKEAAEFGAWEITVSAEGHETLTYTLNPVIGINELQNITLTPLSSSSSDDPSSSSGDDTPSSSSGDDTPSSSSDDDTPSSSSDDEPSSSSDDGDDSSSSVELPKCGGTEYDPETDFCLGSAVTPLCGGKEFTATQFCSGNAVLDKCGGEEYDPGTKFCLGSAVTPLCGGEEFTAAQFCHDGTAIHSKCGGQDYDPTTQYCHDGQISSCDVPHTSAQFCFDGTIYEKCGDEEYDPDAQFCHTDSKVYDKCGGEEYDPGMHLCDARDGKQYGYVSIGSQVWMAENLNYEAEGSWCYNRLIPSCDTYGRLYNWATAMDGATSSTANPSGVQGVCPDGWHLPSDAEWTALTIFVGSTNTETKLKAESGWNYYNGVPGNGSNQYGFSALPGGFGFPTIGTSNVGFQDVRNCGIWWSATEIDDSPAYFRIGATVGGNSYYGEVNLFSVRCLQD